MHHTKRHCFTNDRVTNAAAKARENKFCVSKAQGGTRAMEENFVVGDAQLYLLYNDKVYYSLLGVVFCPQSIFSSLAVA